MMLLTQKPEMPKALTTTVIYTINKFKKTV